MNAAGRLSDEKDWDSLRRRYGTGPFLEHMKGQQITEKAMLKFHTGTINHVNVSAVYSGVCKVNAAIAAQLLIDMFHVDLIINAGTAGGMKEGVQLFDTVISERVIYHDVADDILTDFHPWLKSNYFPADQELCAIARAYSRRSKHPVLFGTMVTGEQFIEDEKREEINQKFDPLSTDMETAGVAHVCYVNRIPFLAVRTITDTVTHQGIETFDQNCEAASEISAEIVLGILGQLD